VDWFDWKKTPSDRSLIGVQKLAVQRKWSNHRDSASLQVE